MTRPTSIPPPIWDALSTEAQAVIAGVIGQLERRIADLEERLNQNSTNSSNSTLAITALSVADCPRDCCHLLRGRARPPEAGPLAAGKYPQVMVER